MINPFEDNPECDFCNIALDEDEDPLQPLYVGEQPRPSPHNIEFIDDKSRGSRGFRILGHDANVFIKLYESIKRHPHMSLNISDRVQVIGGNDATTRYSTDIDRSKFGVNLTVEPGEIETEPDAMVCEDCVEMFRQLGDE